MFTWKTSKIGQVNPSFGHKRIMSTHRRLHQIVIANIGTFPIYGINWFMYITNKKIQWCPGQDDGEAESLMNFVA